MYNEEVHKLYSSQNMIRMITPMSIRRAETAATMRTRVVFWWESQKERDV
jgi:hypothetical protein